MLQNWIAIVKTTYELPANSHDPRGGDIAGQQRPSNLETILNEILPNEPVVLSLESFGYTFLEKLVAIDFNNSRALEPTPNIGQHRPYP